VESHPCAKTRKDGAPKVFLVCTQAAWLGHAI
jgi:hypothetical protein